MVSLQLHFQRIGGKERVVEDRDLRERRGSRERTGDGGAEGVRRTVFRRDPRSFVMLSTGVEMKNGGVKTERKTGIRRKDCGLKIRWDFPFDDGV